MTNTSDTNQKLLDAAELRIRSEGYHAMSFRDLADDLGIKSSSVHYYYRRKENLVLAMVERYSENFFLLLEDLSAQMKPIEALCKLYRASFTAQGHICLCGILGAEKNGLPAEVSNAVAKFLAQNIDWAAAHLPENIGQEHRQRRAEHIVANASRRLDLNEKFDWN